MFKLSFLHHSDCFNRNNVIKAFNVFNKTKLIMFCMQPRQKVAKTSVIDVHSI